ncbi:MAG: KTSC domain-containing protein [Ferruginibacter sp.]
MKIKIDDRHFSILGVTKMSTKEEIKRAYKNLVKLWHPDKFPVESHKNILAQERCKQINEAFSFLKDYVRIVNESASPIEESSVIRKEQKRYNDPNPRANKSFNHIHRIRVNASKLDSVGYDAKLLLLQVALKNGSIYQYHNVPHIVYHAFIMSLNKDQYYSKNIASKFRRE